MMSTFFADVAFTYILIRFFSVIYNLLLFLVNRFCLLFFTEIIVDKHGVKIVSQTIDKKYILNRLLQMNNAFISCKYINSEPYVIAKMQRIIYNIRDMKGGGIVDNGYTKRIRERVLSLEDGTVFVMSDFADIADTSTIRQSLSRLVQSGTLRRILKGVYEKPKYSKLLDEYVAADPEAVANALARSYHWTIAPCGNTALNLLGLSTQVTAVWSYISDGPYKTYEWNSTKLEFKHRTNKEITGLSYMTSLVIQALKTLGRSNVTPEVIQMLSEKLTDKDKQACLKEATESTDWVYDTIRQICGGEKVQ